MAEGKGNNSQNYGHVRTNALFLRRDLDAERNSRTRAPINRSQTYPAILPLCTSRKELANWNWVRLGNPMPKINNLEAAEQRH